MYSVDDFLFLKKVRVLRKAKMYSVDKNQTPTKIGGRDRKG